MTLCSWARTTLVTAALAGSLGACASDPQAPSPGPTGSSTASAAPALSSAPRPVSSAVVATVKDGIILGELREGTSCTGIGEPRSPDGTLTADGTRVVQKFVTGCGCPTGAHYTLLYAPGTSPLEVRLCFGPGKDLCEMVCRGTLQWDLTQPMKQAGASTVTLVPQ